MSIKKSQQREPVEEFYIVVPSDTTTDLEAMKNLSCWYESHEASLVEAASQADDQCSYGVPQVIYRVTKYVEIK